MNARKRAAEADYLLESREDEIYHDVFIDRVGTEPEYYAFVGKVWEFNRAMEWRLLENGTMLCYCQGGDPEKKRGVSYIHDCLEELPPEIGQRTDG